MSAQSGSQGGAQDDAQGGAQCGGNSATERSKWNLSMTSALKGMIPFLGLFIGFLVNNESSKTFTTLFIIDLAMSKWSSVIYLGKDEVPKLFQRRTLNRKVQVEVPESVTYMFQHPTNPNFIVVVTSTSVIIYNFDEGKNSLRKICDLKGSDHNFQYICSAHMSQNGQTLVLWTYDQVQERSQRHVGRGLYEVTQNGIKSHCVRFFRLSSTGGGYQFSPISTYNHPTMNRVEDYSYTGLMPSTCLSQDRSVLLFMFRENIFVLDVVSQAIISVFDMKTIPEVFAFDEWGRIEDLRSMTIVSHRNEHYLILLSHKGLITVLQINVDCPDRVLELKSRYQSPKNPSSSSIAHFDDRSEYHCLASSSHGPLQFIVGGSACGSSDGFVRIYTIGSTGEISLSEEERMTLPVYEVTSVKGVTCALSKHLFEGSAILYRHSHRGKFTPEQCHMILDTRGTSEPKALQSTINGAPIQLEPSGVFTMLPGGAIVASNADNGLTIFGPDGILVASTNSKDAHKSPITSMFSLEVSGTTFVVSFSHSDRSIKIWSIQKRGETVHIRIVATVSTEDIFQKKGVKFLALDGQTLLIVTNQQEFLRFHIELTGGIRAEIRPIPGPVVQMESGQICQGIAAVSPTNVLIHVATSGVRGCSLVLVSLEAGAPEMFKSIGTREAGKSPAALTPNGFAVSAVVPTTVCSTAIAPDGGESCSFTPKYIDKDNKVCDATILAVIPCEGGFICITANGFLFQFVYDAQQKPVFKKRIAVLECALTPKCRLQVSGNTVMVCQPSDDGSFELLSFKFDASKNQ
jgi:hypothetical protein